MFICHGYGLHQYIHSENDIFSRLYLIMLSTSLETMVTIDNFEIYICTGYYKINNDKC
jgi:hypothetical protein